MQEMQEGLTVFPARHSDRDMLRSIQHPMFADGALRPALDRMGEVVRAESLVRIGEIGDCLFPAERADNFIR